ncbi:SMI1/KNR4 family protein [Streptomyces sp. NPDC002057]|uniref:SMI1/KNR4 family protein n=1 Tax=Streptomyces sp. NPDC002057 TaxID=3154664 RepID=UPI00332FA26D
MDISRFHGIIGPPRRNGDVDRDWTDFEQRISLRLPADYKNFISVYGSGCLNNQFLLFHPKGDLENGLNIDLLLRSAYSAYSTLAERSPELKPFPLHPERGGCIAIGRSHGGNYLFLSPPGPECSRWRVVVEMGEWVTFDMSFTEFLWKALNDEIYLPVIEGKPSFDPLGAIDSADEN